MKVEHLSNALLLWMHGDAKTSVYSSIRGSMRTLLHLLNLRPSAPNLVPRPYPPGEGGVWARDQRLPEQAPPLPPKQSEIPKTILIPRRIERGPALQSCGATPT